MTLQALVIDDEAPVRSFVAEVLQEDGWEVSEADSAEHALEILHERDWSAVFCDVVMSGADGFSVPTSLQRGTSPHQSRADDWARHGRGGDGRECLRSLRLFVEAFRR